jgi:undecaprenyl diphosphate synthase
VCQAGCKGVSRTTPPAVQVYCFSTENWRRSEEEVSALMALFDGLLKDLCTSAVEQDTRLHVIGDLSRLPSFLKSTVDRCVPLHLGQIGRLMPPHGGWHH